MRKATFAITTTLHIFTPLYAESNYTLFSSFISRLKSFKHFLNKTVKFPVFLFSCLLIYNEFKNEYLLFQQNFKRLIKPYRYSNGN